MTTMATSEFFSRQLEVGMEGFIWAIRRLPEERLYVAPPQPVHSGGSLLSFGEWSAVRLLFHMVWYDENIAIPSMKQWLGGPAPDHTTGEDDDWAEGHELEALIGRLMAAQRAQIEMLPRFTEETWNRPLPTLWGTQSLNWVVSKTFKHTAEHTNGLMEMVLYWDRHLELLAQEQMNR
jgi:hypothetical protein